MDSLGRFYTSEPFASLLIEQFGTISPLNIVELGVGRGSLLRAALLRWSNANYFAADIDVESVDKVNREFSFVNIIQTNGLSSNIDKKLKIKVNSIDVAFCNPPYLKIKNRKAYSNLLDIASLNECNNLPFLTSDIIFLAQNLRLLKPMGELGIILPDSLITGHNFRLFRKSILTNHLIKGIIELPEKIFPKTDARTYILILIKGSSTVRETPLYIANKDGMCLEKIEISPSKLIERMDFSFHKYQSKFVKSSSLRDLSSLGAEIKRGHFTHNQLKNISSNFVHTTNLQNFQKLDFGNNIDEQNENSTYAMEGDILLSRVGRNVGKVSYVNSGRILISDCIFRIRLSKENVDLVWTALISLEGQRWLQSIAHGVCAKVVSKIDLLRFPINQNFIV
jgi:tRNA1(Val) A37 N6-methylase TrmN6